MSKVINTTNKKNNTLPFCKVCKDSGKSEQIFTSHYIRDLKSGRVLCPTLLSQQCRRCSQNGHTIKYCKLSELSTNAMTTPQRPIAKAISTPQKYQQNAQSRSSFAFLMMSDDENSEDESTEDEDSEEFPQLCALLTTSNTTPVVEAKKAGQFSYSAVTAKTVIEYKIEQIKEQKQSAPIISNKIKVQFGFNDSSNSIRTSNNSIVDGIDLKTGKKFSWADCDSSDSDEEENEDNSAW